MKTLRKKRIEAMERARRYVYENSKAYRLAILTEGQWKKQRNDYIAKLSDLLF